MTAAALGRNSSRLSSATGRAGAGSQPLDDVDGAWESAQRAAEFAALIGVRCEAEGHGTSRCLVRDIAQDGARRALTLGRELAGVEVAA